MEKLRRIFNKLSRRNPDGSIRLRKEPVYLNKALITSVALNDHPEWTKERREAYESVLKSPRVPKAWFKNKG